MKRVRCPHTTQHGAQAAGCSQCVLGARAKVTRVAPREYAPADSDEALARAGLLEVERGRLKSLASLPSDDQPRRRREREPQLERATPPPAEQPDGVRLGVLARQCATSAGLILRRVPDLVVVDGIVAPAEVARVRALLTARSSP